MSLAAGIDIVDRVKSVVAQTTPVTVVTEVSQRESTAVGLR